MKNKVVVVSRRDTSSKKSMWDFVHHYRLPIDEIYTTDNGPKREILIELGAIRHYDDDPRMKYELKGTNCEFIFVDPMK